MVALVVVPLAVVQVLAIHALQHQQDDARAAARLADEIRLMSDVGTLYGPVALEATVSAGLAEIDATGVERSVLTDALGLDFEPYLVTARQAVERGVSALIRRHGDHVLADGRTVSAHLTPIMREVRARRAEIDAHRADPAATSRTLTDLHEFVETLADEALTQHTVGATGRLAELDDASAHLLSLMSAVAEETRQVAGTLGARTSDASTANAADSAILAAGASSYAIDEYRRFLTDVPAVTRWQAVLDSPGVRRLDTVQPLITASLAERSGQSGADTSLVLADPAFLRTITTVFDTLFGRLDVFEGYSNAEFGRQVAEATSIGHDAVEAAERGLVALAVLTVLCLSFLALVVATTIGPLERLTRRAVRLGRGEVDAHPLRVVGPSDLRAVTETFNTLVHTLSDVDREMSLLASGATLDADHVVVPGALGVAVRGSVQRVGDVTQQLRDSEALSRAIIETAADAIWTVDHRGVVLTANGAAETLLGLDNASQCGLSLPSLLGGRRLVDELVGELSFDRVDGRVVDVLVSNSRVSNGRVSPDDTLHTVFARDISDRKRFEVELAYQARHDGLTGLPNRVAALEHLDDALERCVVAAAPVSVLFIDLDGFKAVNDSRGHTSGDELLREIGRRLQQTLRKHEFVARLGGDEFLVVVEGLEVDGAVALAERIGIELAQPYSHGDDLFAVSASVGVSCSGDRGLVSDGGVDGLELVREADVAVYHAKARGRARTVVFDASLQESVEANAAIELALRHGISHGELILHYQPVLDLATQRVWGVEALVRWERPGHGLLEPDRFVPVAERSSLIVELERWVLIEACRTLAEWHRDPRFCDMHMAVNISGRHLVDGDLISAVDEALGATGANPAWLELEITETHLLADFERANEVLSELRHRGITIAVDDFGTGYSSMGYLRQLEIDTIKIDRMFIARATEAGYDRTIVEVLLQLGETLSLSVVAEGVETADQLAFLMDRRCHRAQGYGIARPMARTDIEATVLEVGARAPSSSRR